MRRCGPCWMPPMRATYASSWMPSLTMPAGVSGPFTIFWRMAVIHLIWIGLWWKIGRCALTPQTAPKRSIMPPGGALRRCPSSILPTKGCVTTCLKSHAIGLTLALTAGAWMCRKRSKMKHSGRISAGWSKPPTRRPTLSGRSGIQPKIGCAGIGSMQ